MCQHTDESVSDTQHLFAESPIGSHDRCSESLLGSRLDNIKYRFSLCQVYSPVEERSLGELARLSHSGAAFEYRFQHSPQRRYTAMTVYFDDIFAGVRMGSVHHADEDFVYLPPVLDDMTVDQSARAN
jgi:hypothetical protein